MSSIDEHWPLSHQLLGAVFSAARPFALRLPTRSGIVNDCWEPPAPRAPIAGHCLESHCRFSHGFPCVFCCFWSLGGHSGQPPSLSPPVVPGHLHLLTACDSYFVLSVSCRSCPATFSSVFNFSLGVSSSAGGLRSLLRAVSVLSLQPASMFSVLL